MNSNSLQSLKSIDCVRVKYRGKDVGVLRMDRTSNNCIFRYDSVWLAEGFSISPLDLPLKDGMFAAKPNPFKGNFGVFEDSLPDGYGCYLLDRLLRKQGINLKELTPLQWLSIIGNAGMGALTYEPSVMEVETHLLPALEEIQDLALDVLSDRNERDADVLYFNSGNSGGCRPKCLYRDDDGEWLVKFRHTYDSDDIGRMEYEYALAATACGIRMPEFKLLENKYYASKRFDLMPDGKRAHVVTAGGLLNESIFPPKLDYSILLQLTGYITQNPDDVEQMFRRMVFNVFSCNKDDHAKNFSFLCNEGIWELAPAYDLTYSPAGYGGEHATSLNYNGNPTENDMLKAGIRFLGDRDKTQEIISLVKAKARPLLNRWR